jgi:transcriptional antiterminator RfaH
VYGQEDARHRAITTNCVSRCLDVKDGAKLTTDLRRIHQLIECGVDITPEARLQSGMLVRIRSGPLAGQEGVVVERQGDRRLLVAVDFLQQGASVLLDQAKLERLDIGVPAERSPAGFCR